MSNQSLSVRSARPPARTLVSSSLGFSRPGGAEIRSLNDLLRTIQPLNLRLYDSVSLRNPVQVGEGTSYTVFRYLDSRTKELVAIKQIKQPDGSSNHHIFQSRVDCVLRDIEVMYHPPIAQHENILTLLGYGWGLIKGDLIPFIVTDYAALGTLREYLNTKTAPLQTKLALCSQVACGLNRLHWTGVAHGDLKLENVLVFHNSAVQSAGTYESEVIVKLSDFGHACLFSDEQGDGVTQVYRGTIWYLAPELRHGRTLKTVEFLRCDVWALGLLCWEALWDGTQYFRLPVVEAIKGWPKSVGEIVKSFDIQGQIADLCPAFAETAAKSIDELSLLCEFRSFQKQMIKGILRQTLQPDPAKRPYQLSTLPFIFGAGLHSAWNEWTDENESLSISRDLLPNSWTYESFTPKVASGIPFRVKAQMVLDAKRTALAKHNDSARAALQVGVAFFNAFGLEQDLSMAVESIKRSTASGCRPAEILLAFLREQCPDLSKPQKRAQVSQNQHSVFSKLGILVSPRLLSASSCRTLSPAGLNKLENCSPQVGPSLLKQCLTACSESELSLGREDSEASIIIASQLGDLDSLLALASKVETSTNQQYIPTALHYLFMFDQDDEALDQALKALLPMRTASEGPVLEAYCFDPQTLDKQLPFSFEGTPLNFAVVAGSRRAVGALLRAGANPLSAHHELDTAIHIPKNPLESAVSYHQEDIFLALWEAALLRAEWRADLNKQGFYALKSLFAKLSARSRMEIWITQRSDDGSTQSRMVSALLGAVWDLLRSDITVPGANDPESIFAQVIADGLQHILSLDGLEVANKLFNHAAEVSGRSLVPLLSDTDQEALMNAILDIACKGSVAPRRAIAYIELGELLFASIKLSVGFRALLASIHHHNDTLFSTLLIDGRYFSEVDSDGRGILWHIVDTGFSRMVPLTKILELNLKPDISDRFGETPFHCAVRAQSLGDMAVLVRAGADVHRRLLDGRTALHLATENLDVSIISYLLDRGVAINAIDNRFGRSAIHALFLEAPRQELSSVFAVATFLLSKGASTSIIDASGWTSVHALAFWDDEVFSNIEFSRLLKRLDLAARGKDGTTLLHSAARRCKDRLVTMVVDLAMSVDDQDNSGATPLHALALSLTNSASSLRTETANRLIPTAVALLKGNPNMLLTDKDSLTALDRFILACGDVRGAVSIGTRIDLLRLVLDHCCPKPPGNRHLRQPNSEVLKAAWTHAVSSQRWLAAREIICRQQVDVSLLRWPVGMRFLLFAIERADLQVLRLFFGIEPHDSHLFSFNTHRIAQGRERPFQIPSERSEGWSAAEHTAWEAQISADDVHYNHDNQSIPRDIMDFFLKNEDLYKMGPLRSWGADKSVPRSWPVVDELLIEYQDKEQNLKCRKP
ncbi:hypothetical protein F5Y19DRAFT_61701 [Xylariaceae sp. FL1651]|nr:hypothetical protein F5Y19DRAFT_61701 [Xylariaceae sp. FL1651]